MGTLGLALVVGGSALLISLLIFLIPSVASAVSPWSSLRIVSDACDNILNKCAETVTTYDARLLLDLAHLTASSSCSRSSLSAT